MCSIVNNCVTMNNKKTYKMSKRTRKKKKDIWNQFDETKDECKNESNNVETKERCIGAREFCEICKSGLAITEEGFLACTNRSCCIIYKDMVDESAEWRYYGADDNNSSDPTRCGMPINPLLKESSFGCKVVCPRRCSYEMRKIKRYSDWQSRPYKEKSQY